MSEPGTVLGMIDPGLASPRLVRLNAVCPYFTMFPLSFPFERLASARPGDWVLDPFCGRGTTLFAARLRGLGSAGIDTNPVAAAIAAAKLVSVSADEVIALCERLLDTEKGGVPDGEFWRWAYAPSTLADIAAVRHGLLNAGHAPEAIALRAILLGILHGPRQRGLPTYLSNQMPRTYATKPGPAVKYWTSRAMEPGHVDVRGAVARRARFTMSDLPASTPGWVARGDCRTLPRRQGTGPIRWIITSPPYLGMRTYLPDQWLRNWFLGGPPGVDYACPGQIPQGHESFSTGLADAWTSVADIVEPGARLIVRFGKIPSADVDATSLLLETLERSDRRWVVKSIESAGPSTRGKRQAVQFKRTPGGAAEEIDLEAVLDA